MRNSVSREQACGPVAVIIVWAEKCQESSTFLPNQRSCKSWSADVLQLGSHSSKRVSGEPV